MCKLLSIARMIQKLKTEVCLPRYNFGSLTASVRSIALQRSQHEVSFMYTLSCVARSVCHYLPVVFRSFGRFERYVFQKTYSMSSETENPQLLRLYSPVLTAVLFPAEILHLRAQHAEERSVNLVRRTLVLPQPPQLPRIPTVLPLRAALDIRHTMPLPWPTSFLMHDRRRPFTFLHNKVAHSQLVVVFQHLMIVVTRDHQPPETVAPFRQAL